MLTHVHTYLHNTIVRIQNAHIHTCTRTCTHTLTHLHTLALQIGTTGIVDGKYNCLCIYAHTCTQHYCTCIKCTHIYTHTCPRITKDTTTTVDSKYRLHTKVQVSMRFTLPRDASPRWCKKRRDEPRCVTDLYYGAIGYVALTTHLRPSNYSVGHKRLERVPSNDSNHRSRVLSDDRV